jgi:translation initiation factor 2B subunit (eIF-2B alpha/beta/delta family)
MVKKLVEIVDRTVRNHRRGATEIEHALLDDLLEARDSWSDETLAECARRLREGQPSMANLRSLASMLDGARVNNLELGLVARRTLLNELPSRLGEAARARLSTSQRVVTISRSSTVASVLVWAWRAGWRGETVVLDGSPAGCGPDQAEWLATRGLKVVSQPDAAAVKWLEGDGVLVISGADAVSPRRFVNACGTGGLLELAAARSVPRVLIADTAKNVDDREIDDFLKACRPGSERGPGRQWPIFEAISLALVSLRIDEEM